MEMKKIKVRLGKGMKIIGFFLAFVLPAFAIEEDYYEYALPYFLIGGGVFLMIGEWLAGEKARWMLPMIAALLGVFFLLVHEQIPLATLFMILSLILTVVLYLIERKEKRESPVQDLDEKRDKKWW
ncbi:hypothetical protein AV656_08490 [Bhargavaea cecembensis]|uniref:Uncharacterized protein n=1 Tax=Bhargavaea cecembensis TaxID=394098 RepID=A0A165H6N1_9BACL|nr:hypothetical protein [Bhargavaea cecembensis]KZE38929.1 hypothetical protein AV656_08490 [Bhargavaea cecembensis]